MKKTLFLMFIIVLLSSCRGTKKYFVVKQSNSIENYENYIAKYPKSNFIDQARKDLDSLYFERDWGLAKSANTIESYDQFIMKYPNSGYETVAKGKIKEFEINKAWKTAQKVSTIYSYQNFLNAYPNSKYSFKANMVKHRLEDDLAWEEAELEDSIESYNNYISKFPDGLRKINALKKIKEYEIVLPNWKLALDENTPNSFREFLNQFPSSSFSSQAKSKLRDLENQYWKNASDKKSKKKLRKYLSNFPRGKYINEAKKAIIDIEVNEIFAEDHGELPPMSKKLGGNSNVTINEIEVTNDTKYILTVRYSGNTESKKIVLKPGMKEKFTLKKDSYKVAASVDAEYVTNYAGQEKLHGGIYTINFYITTTTYQTK